MRSMTRRRCSSEMKRDRGLLDDAVALDVDVVAAVDHDLVDGGIVEELLDGAEPHHVPGDVLRRAAGAPPVTAPSRSRPSGRRSRPPPATAADPRCVASNRRVPRRSNSESCTLALKSPSPSTVDGPARRLAATVSATSPRCGGGLLGLVDALGEAHRRHPFLALVGLDGGVLLRQLLQLLGDRRPGLADRPRGCPG